MSEKTEKEKEMLNTKLERLDLLTNEGVHQALGANSLLLDPT